MRKCRTRDALESSSSHRFTTNTDMRFHFKTFIDIMMSGDCMHLPWSFCWLPLSLLARTVCLQLDLLLKIFNSLLTVDDRRQFDKYAQTAQWIAVNCTDSSHKWAGNVRFNFMLQIAWFHRKSIARYVQLRPRSLYREPNKEWKLHATYVAPKQKKEKNEGKKPSAKRKFCW